MKILASTLLAVSLNVSAQSQMNFVEAWRGFSDPDIFDSGFINEFASLPLEGSMVVGPKGWSGDYWASKKGGINIRWNTPDKKGFDYKSPDKELAASMTIDELSALAPTEKYDLFVGDYKYSLKKEASGTASKLARDWAGICHGWAPASIFHNEPTPKVMTNPDGIKIPFGSADIKALISYFYAFHHDTETDQMGLRCFFGRWLGGSKACNNDLNAGAFHIVIANKMGLQKEGFMMDVDRFSEVWNQPAVAYKSTILNNDLNPSKDAAKNAVREVRIATEIFYADESDPTWEVGFGTKNQIIAKKDLVYRVEIDAQGKIVGGEWESDERPDFIWNKKPATLEEFSGIFKDLPRLLND